jgi:RNA polymerase-binding protein DksA
MAFARHVSPYGETGMALTQEQTQKLQSTVEKRRAALRAEIEQGLGKVRADRLRDLAGASPDPGDESVASLISDLDQADTSRDISELRSLDQAHQRIVDGSYGTCIECGLDIGFARLQANPAAERCIECQTQYEKTHASPSGSTL